MQENQEYQKRAKTKYLIVHCSQSDIFEHDNIETIDRWHRQQGWNSIGYHYFISKDGKIWLGRPDWSIGAHCYSYNDESLGICLSGQLRFMSEQFRSLRKFCGNQKKIYPELQIKPHNFLNPDKTCPNFCLEYLLDLWQIE
jgi:N-acetyl-anhydromuramyl-L-alanine amidase AmpD